MSEPDIVAELDEWIRLGEDDRLDNMCQRARDEIVALRKRVSASEQVRAEAALEAVRRARAQALEEAAQACEQLSRRRFHVSDHHSRQAARECVRAIRALMDRDA